jgi:type I restriction enzyme S subunit
VRNKNPQELPSGWVFADLHTCSALITKGSTPTTYGFEYKSTGIAFVRVENLAGGYIDRSTIVTFIDKSADEALKRSRLQAGDLLFSIAGTIGRTALVRHHDLPANTNQAVAIIRGTAEAFNATFLRLILSSTIAQHQARSDARGGAMNNISLSDVKGILIPVPPLAEQLRIAQEIEKQFTRLEAAVAALKRVQANLKRYRASVLKAACEGRLVPTEAELVSTARSGCAIYEPADQLLARILAERRAKWEAGQLAKMNARQAGVGAGFKPARAQSVTAVAVGAGFKPAPTKPVADKWKAKYKEPAAPDTSNLPELPEGWVWATLAQLPALEPNAITDGPFGSNLKTSHYTEDGPRVIRLQNIGDGAFVDERAHISQPHFEALRKHQVGAGDLVIAALGERPPRACVIPDWVGPAIVKADCIRFRPFRSAVLAEYLNCALNAEPTRSRTAEIVHGVGRPRLNLDEIKRLSVPLPPPNEQHRIVAEVERRLSVIDELEATVEANLKRAERLRQSILKRAFEGKLVPQDPNDEPASVLLERIRAERSQAAKGRAALKSVPTQLTLDSP